MNLSFEFQVSLIRDLVLRQTQTIPTQGLVLRGHSLWFLRKYYSNSFYLSPLLIVNNEILSLKSFLNASDTATTTLNLIYVIYEMVYSLACSIENGYTHGKLEKRGKTYKETRQALDFKLLSQLAKCIHSQWSTPFLL